MKKTKVLVLMGLFIALHVILTRIIRPVELPYLRVSFGFLATSLSAILMGPVLSGVNAAISDIVGYFLFPSGSAFFPGFTISAFLTGLIYGVFLYKKPKSLIRIGLAVLIISIVVDLGLNTLWLSMLYEKAWMVLFGGRLIKTAILFPVQIAFIYMLWKYLGSRIPFIANFLREEPLPPKDVKIDTDSP
jgi:ECF transporter S component (folate family)